MSVQLGKKYYLGSRYQQQFLEYLKANKIAGLKCSSCQSVYFPPRQICPSCRVMNEDVQWIELSGKGIVETFTTIYYAPVGFEEEVPYTIVVVKLSEGPKMMCLAEEKVDVGDDIVLRPKFKGNEAYLVCEKDLAE